MSTPSGDKLLERFQVVAVSIPFDLAFRTDNGVFANQLVRRPNSVTKKIDPSMNWPHAPFADAHIHTLFRKQLYLLE